MDRRHAHDEILGQVHQGFVSGIVAVRVVVAGDVADDLGALARPAVEGEVQVVVHRVQDAALHRLEAVTHVGQGAGGDDRQSVGAIACLDLLPQRPNLDGFRHEQPSRPPPDRLSCVDCSKRAA